MPKTTFNNHVTTKSKSFQVGLPTVFTETEEKLLVEYIIGLSKIGYGIDINNLQIIVKNLIIQLNKDTPFKNSTPGLDWIYG